MIDAMADEDARRDRERLPDWARIAIGSIALVFLVSAVLITFRPPDRTVALAGCPDQDPDCLVKVDSDTTTLAAALLALAAVAGLIALMGVRPKSVTGPGMGLDFSAAAAGLPSAEPQPAAVDQESGDHREARDVNGGVHERAESLPVRVEVKWGLGAELGSAPIAVASLDVPMTEIDGKLLRDYQSARRTSQQGWFLTHILGPATSPGQEYSVAIKVTPHRSATGDVRAARFFFGKAWGYQVFEGSRGADGRFGITTEAYGPFLALCEVEFTSGERLLLDHYCDFEMGGLVVQASP
jgi:hypothetical protein